MNRYFTLTNRAFCGNEDVFDTLSDLDEIKPMNSTEVIYFDLNGIKEMNPFNMLLLARKVYQVRHKFPENKFAFIPKQDSDYLEHMGFYHAMGTKKHGRQMGEAWGNSQYMGIKEIDISMPDFYDKIEDISGELSRVLGFDSNLARLIKYSFVETIRNVYEHAETKKAYICAQKWPSHNLVEVAILDEGRGIANALGQRFRNKSELELLKMSIQPGVSAKSNHSYLGKKDSWRNSGYGLFVLKELCKNYEAPFYLCSNNFALIQNHKGVLSFYETKFSGTAVALRFRTNINVNFQNVIQTIVAEGESISKGIEGSIKTASKSSGGRYTK